jgi:hypothetical protein
MSPVDILMSHEMAYLALALTAVMLLVGRVRVTKTSLINETSAWQWFGTVIVLVLGIVGAFIVHPESCTGPGEKILFGIIAAAFASTGRSLLKEPLFKKLEGGQP